MSYNFSVIPFSLHVFCNSPHPSFFFLPPSPLRRRLSRLYLCTDQATRAAASTTIATPQTTTTLKGHGLVNILRGAVSRGRRW